MSDEQCGYAAFCDKYAEETEDKVCRVNGSLKNGARVGVDDNPSACESGFTYQADFDGVANYVCGRGRVSEPGFGTEAKFETQDKCEYIEYTTSDENGTPDSVPAKCGFNQDASYYCPVWQGDEVYKTFWNDWTVKLTTAKART